MSTMLTALLAYFFGICFCYFQFNLKSMANVLFVSTLVVLVILTSFTPQTSENLPILTIFFIVIISIGIVGAFMCALVINLAAFETRKMMLRSRNIKVEPHFLLRCCPGLTASSVNAVCLILYAFFTFIFF